MPELNLRSALAPSGTALSMPSEPPSRLRRLTARLGEGAASFATTVSSAVARRSRTSSASIPQLTIHVVDPGPSQANPPRVSSSTARHPIATHSVPVGGSGATSPTPTTNPAQDRPVLDGFNNDVDPYDWLHEHTDGMDTSARALFMWDAARATPKPEAHDNFLFLKSYALATLLTSEFAGELASLGTTRHALFEMSFAVTREQIAEPPIAIAFQ